ncbi:vitamin K epoxide reductase family protein [Halobium palmae]|uniref:Vitamin K epoxide reductase family protein n=1 Tax=Halobium palmae TaxID=1776492 RepID=A0ABD5RUH9_9EURY
MSNTHQDEEDQQEPGDMMLNHPVKEKWIQYGVISLGIWLVFSPMTFSYESIWLTWSDIITGTVLVTLSTITIRRNNPWASYANGFVGFWLLMAPLVFHAPTAAAYLNDTLVGILVITFSIIVMMRMEMDGGAVPQGWSYNPSTAAQRAPLIALAIFGFITSRYMAAYQLGYIDAVWDPVFGDGTRQILESQVSAAFPVSDAGLGAVAYALEGLMGFMGDKTRWRTMPWMVTFFGIVVIPLGFVQVLLVISQPILVGAWCTLCLLSAFGMLWMISLSFDEVIAMGQLLKRRTEDDGVSLWHGFWMGGTLSEDDVGLDGETRDNRDRPAGMFWGVSTPWYLLGAMALGFWLMLSPTVFGTEGVLADANHLIGALVVSFSVIATAEPVRVFRYVNILLGAAVIVVPWVIGAPLLPALNATVAGALLAGASVPRGTIRDQYGYWWPKYIR